jgi:demethylmenaquinone methyltransferase / 2-methoxy-6-polyprenyl-1,4-benzoquinol methylase
LAPLHGGGEIVVQPTQPGQAKRATDDALIEPLPPHPLLTRYHSSEQERRVQISRWFDGTAPGYDFITQAMSFGSGHRYRRQVLVRSGLKEGMRLLDVACGTGVLTAHAQDIVGTAGLVTGLDPSRGMLHEARRRGARRLVRAVAETLPVESNGFDFLTMGYALRHVADLRATFREYRRVLKPGGKLLILEITPPRSRLSHYFLKLYLGRIIPVVARFGRGGRGSGDLMRYYWDTIEHCVTPPVILGALQEAGFQCIERQVEMGILSTYSATR